MPVDEVIRIVSTVGLPTALLLLGGYALFRIGKPAVERVITMHAEFLLGILSTNRGINASLDKLVIGQNEARTIAEDLKEGQANIQAQLHEIKGRISRS